LSFYLDTSLVVSAFTAETDTLKVQRWLDANAAAPLAISPWIETEFSSALSKKMREGNLTLEIRSLTTAQWHLFRDALTDTIAIVSQDFDTAARFVANYSLGLRASDALHLAVAARHGATLATLDRVMAAAATTCGVPVAIL
jgi:uncharacterized protein